MLLLFILIIIMFIKNDQTQCENIISFRRKLRYWRHESLAAIRKQRFRSATDNPPYYPNGWTYILLSHELVVGAVKTVIAFGKELVAFRGDSGQIYVVDSFCRDLSENGRVVSIGDIESINCPIHCITFNGKDGLLERKSDTKNAFIEKIKIWEVLEQDHIISIWHHTRGERSHSLPFKINDQLIYMTSFFNYQTFTFQFSQDIPIWENKIYIKTPLYTKHDKGIIEFRKWSEQFY